MMHLISPKTGAALCLAFYETLTPDPAAVTCRSCLNLMGAVVRASLCKHVNAVALSGTYDSYECPDCDGIVRARDFPAEILRRYGSVRRPDDGEGAP